MLKFARVTMVFAAGMLAAAVLATAQTKDPFVGTWTLNVAKSKYDPGPAPKGGTTTYEAAGKGYKVTVKAEPASGPALQWSYGGGGQEGRERADEPEARRQWRRKDDDHYDDGHECPRPEGQ